jgi:hypothetical protein
MPPLFEPHAVLLELTRKVIETGEFNLNNGWQAELEVIMNWVGITRCLNRGQPEHHYTILSPETPASIRDRSPIPSAAAPIEARFTLFPLHRHALRNSSYTRRTCSPFPLRTPTCLAEHLCLQQRCPPKTQYQPICLLQYLCTFPWRKR